MAKGMFRTSDGLVMVEYGNRRSAISRARYKANGYSPVYEKLELQSAGSCKGAVEIRRDKKASALQPSYARGQNWLRNDSKDGIVESYDQQLKTRDYIVESYERQLRTK